MYIMYTGNKLFANKENGSALIFLRAMIDFFRVPVWIPDHCTLKFVREPDSLDTIDFLRGAIRNESSDSRSKD